MATSFVFSNPDAMRSVCGINDTNIPYLEKLLGCSIYVRGDRIECQTGYNFLICEINHTPRTIII